MRCGIDIYKRARDRVLCMYESEIWREQYESPVICGLARTPGSFQYLCNVLKLLKLSDDSKACANQTIGLIELTSTFYKTDL